MDFVQVVQGLIGEGTRRVLVIGSEDKSFVETLFSAQSPQELWTLSTNSPLQNNRVHRAITGTLSTVPLGVLPPHTFDLVLVLGDLPFGSNLHPFLQKLARLIHATGKTCIRIPNSSSADRISARIRNSFELKSSSGFTPAEARCALAAANFKVVSELTAYLPDSCLADFVATVSDDASARETLLVAEKTFVAALARPIIDSNQGIGEGDGLTKTSLIVLTYNSASTIEACLFSALATLGEHDEIIVVDNASQDDTIDKVTTISDTCSQITLVRNSDNLGFSAGCNVGIRSSRGSFIALLNPDTLVWPGWIDALQRPFKDSMVGMVGPLSDRISGTQFLGHFLAPAHEPETPEQLATICRNEFAGQYLETKLLIGLCVMIRRETLRKVGLLDEKLFLGSDDLELSWRLRTHGLKLLVSKEAFVHHLGGVSFASLDGSDKKRLLFESTEALLEKVRVYYGWNPPDRLLWGIDITHR